MDNSFEILSSHPTEMPLNESKFIADSHDEDDDLEFMDALEDGNALGCQPPRRGFRAAARARQASRPVGERREEAAAGMGAAVVSRDCACVDRGGEGDWRRGESKVS